MMKSEIRALILLLVISIPSTTLAQKESLTLDATFAAIIVKDMARSVQWYSEVLNFEIVNETNNKERGLKQANLIQGSNKLELIEINSAIDPTENGAKRVFVQGIFKIGFSISDFENWKNHLIALNLITENDIVKDPTSAKKMMIIKDPDGNRIQLFEN